MIEVRTIRKPDLTAAPFAHQLIIDVAPFKAALVFRASFDFSASAVVAVRTPLALIRDLPEMTAVSSEPNVGVTAGQAALVQFVFGAPWDLGSLTTLRTNEFPRIPKTEVFMLEVSVVNGQAGDAMSDFVVQYLYGDEQEILAMVR